MSYSQRLHHVIPGGAHTYSRGSDQFPSNAPEILVRGKGAYVWDTNNRRYLDYGMALRAVTVGYADSRINAAAYKQIKNGNNLTRASLIELEAAELITQIIPGFEMVKFAKNGSNATTAAVKIARAFTGRRYVCVPRQHPFFSFDDWFIGTTELQRGIPKEYVISTLIFDYNNIDSLRRLFLEYPNQIAAVMLEPATSIVPCHPRCSEITFDSDCKGCPNWEGNFLYQVEKLCKEKGAIFILDEMITGFRWSLNGAGHYFGVKPDLMTFGKGMANGFSVAAVGGRRDLMEVGSIDEPGKERTFLLSTTHGGEMCGLGAFIETVKIYKETNLCSYLWEYGAQLKKGMNSLAVAHGIEEYFEVIGPPVLLNYVTKDQNHDVSSGFRTLFAQEMLKHGVLIPWIAFSYSHTNRDLELTLSACDKSFRVLRQALENGLEAYLEGPELKPVFRKYN
jgi:glutamate-1-semialdehyde 2,1-aminomutase